MIDHEHGYGDVKGITRQIQSLKETGCSPLVRMPKDDEVYVKKTLDTGVNSLMFPLVNNKKEAENIVEMCRYAPKGYRGMYISRASNYGMNIKKYYETIEKNLLIVCQIETSEGVSNIEEISEVDGIDMLFIGFYSTYLMLSQVEQTTQTKSTFNFFFKTVYTALTKKLNIFLVFLN